MHLLSVIQTSLMWCKGGRIFSSLNNRYLHCYWCSHLTLIQTNLSTHLYSISCCLRSKWNENGVSEHRVIIYICVSCVLLNVQVCECLLFPPLWRLWVIQPVERKQQPVQSAAFPAMRKHFSGLPFASDLQWSCFWKTESSSHHAETWEKETTQFRIPSFSC